MHWLAALGSLNVRSLNLWHLPGCISSSLATCRRWTLPEKVVAWLVVKTSKFSWSSTSCETLKRRQPCLKLPLCSCLGTSKWTQPVCDRFVSVLESKSRFRKRSRFCWGGVQQLLFLSMANVVPFLVSPEIGPLNLLSWQDFEKRHPHQKHPYLLCFHRIGGALMRGNNGKLLLHTLAPVLVGPGVKGRPNH